MSAALCRDDAWHGGTFLATTFFMKPKFFILYETTLEVGAILVLAFGLHSVHAQFSFVPGHYYSANYSSRTITQYDSSGAVVGSFTVPSELADEVRGLAFGPDGLLYITAAWGSGFNVLAYDESRTLRQLYPGNVYVHGNLSYGKLAVDNRYIYVAGQNQLTRFEIGDPSSGAPIYYHNQVFDVDLMPNGNVLVLSAYYLDEITPSGSLVRQFPARFTDARGVEYDPATDKLFVTHLGHTGFYFQVMRFNWTTGVMEASTYFWYGDDIFLTDSGMLLVGSRTMPPTFFTQDLTPVGTLAGGQQMFVTQLLPSCPPTNAAPAITCPGATVAECGSEVTLTAQVSDPEGNPMLVVWTLNGTAIQTNFVPAGSPGVMTALSLSSSLPLGTNILQISASDGINVNSCVCTVTVVDTVPPVIDSIEAIPAVLWPPNHRMVKVVLQASVRDRCSEPAWRIVGIECNEPANAARNHTSPDWCIADEHTVFLRAERSASGDGRIYFIQVQATDSSGNQSETETVTVSVPKSPGKPR